MSLFRTAAIAALLAAVAVACAGGSTSPAPAASVPADVDAAIAAKDVRFDKSQLTLPADEPTTIFFDNQENLPHNVAITDGSGATVFEGELFNGPAQRVYEVPPLAAGTYKFICTVHPDMTGELTVR